MAECFFSTIYILLIKTTKKFVNILEEMFVEKKKKCTVLNPLTRVLMGTGSLGLAYFWIWITGPGNERHKNGKTQKPKYLYKDSSSCTFQSEITSMNLTDSWLNEVIFLLL